MEEKVSADITAEDLRLQGNDAFGTKDWKRALDLYQRSSSYKPQAKTYSNIAATLCKLSRYTEANNAAKRATILEPTWAKGWWRRGVVAELQKIFLEALKYFMIAVDLDPKEKTFKKALNNIKKRVNAKTENGMEVITNPGDVGSIEESAAVKAWFMAQQSVGGSTFTMTSRYMAVQTTYPTSQQWLFQGFNQWIAGMKGAVASLCVGVSRDAHDQWQALNQRQWTSEEEFLASAEELLGGFSEGQDLGNLASGFAHLGGLHIAMETGGRRSPHDPIRRQLCSQPRFLSHIVSYQMVAVLWSIEMHFIGLFREYGFDRHIKCSAALLAASTTLFANIRTPYPHNINDMEQDPSPHEVVSYIKKQLRAGRTWNGGLRQFVSVQYRGSIMFACITRMIGQVAAAYKSEKWAHDFITLADEQFKVTKEKSFEEKGSAFRPSFRIGMMMSEFQSLNALRGGAVNGPYSMEHSLNLCVEISDMANSMELQTEADNYLNTQNAVAFRQKPLALAHSSIGAHLTFLEQHFSLEKFKQIACRHGFIESIDSDCDPFFLIAEHYLIAAENELPDSQDGAIFWWACAANMARATLESGYTIGRLRTIISKAEAAEQARDVSLFGINEQRGGSLETIARITADYLQEKSESFVLPRVKLVRAEGKQPSAKTILSLGDEVICPNFDEYERNETRRFKENRYANLMDTSEIEREHGASFEGIPCLETLCIRELHKSGLEFAKGETDGAVIHYKSMMAAFKKRSFDN